MEKIRGKKGITLIALIVTIIILLILLGVSTKIVINSRILDVAEEKADKANNQETEQEQQKESIQNDWDEIPGETIKSPTKQNTTIELSATASNVTETSFRVNANGTNSKGETLTFILKVGDTTYPEKTGKEVYWDVTGLTPKTIYGFEVIGRDSTSENNVIGYVKTLGNTAPTLTVSHSNVTATTATITATGSDEDGDTLTYSLTINNKTTSNSTGLFDVKGLSSGTTYSYTATVSDGKGGTATKTGSLKTLTQTCSLAVVCYGDEDNDCDTCGGAGYLSVYDRFSTITSSASNCSNCGKTYSGSGWYGKCQICGGYAVIHPGDRDGWILCPGANQCDCDGICPDIDSHYCTPHDMYGVHYYCTTHNYVGESQTHTY